MVQKGGMVTLLEGRDGYFICNWCSRQSFAEENERHAEEDGERVVGGRGTLGVPLPPLMMNLKVVMGCNSIDKSAGSVAALLQSSSTPTAQFKTLLLQ